ncbi:hypothetical protein BTVI_122209 [Pitangus sulphuratus]|nr:hypothetical protein BTVI_122209 [Pitangus sulphuratus]
MPMVTVFVPCSQFPHDPTPELPRTPDAGTLGLRKKNNTKQPCNKVPEASYFRVSSSLMTPHFLTPEANLSVHKPPKPLQDLLPVKAGINANPIVSMNWDTKEASARWDIPSYEAQLAITSDRGETEGPGRHQYISGKWMTDSGKVQAQSTHNPGARMELAVHGSA